MTVPTGGEARNAAGDSIFAWAAREPDAGREWLELDYEPPLVAHQVRIHETDQPGAVVELILVDAMGSEILRRKVADTVERAPAYLEVSFELTDTPVKTVRVVLDTTRASGWNEIDAVELVGREGRAWAAEARSSSYFVRD